MVSGSLQSSSGHGEGVRAEWFGPSSLPARGKPAPTSLWSLTDCVTCGAGWDVEVLVEEETFFLVSAGD